MNEVRTNVVGELAEERRRLGFCQGAHGGEVELVELRWRRERRGRECKGGWQRERSSKKKSSSLSSTRTEILPRQAVD
jgi:hypothetical protein